MQIKHYFTKLFMVAIAGSLFLACGSETNEETTSDASGAEHVGHADHEHHDHDQHHHGDEELKKGEAQFSFEKTSINFGHVKLGEKVTERFIFTNTGNEPLVIYDASAGCGCTVPDYSNEPIPPGEEGFVDVSYNSAGRPVARFQQTVTLQANTPEGRKQLRISGEVVESDGTPGEGTSQEERMQQQIQEQLDAQMGQQQAQTHDHDHAQDNADPDAPRFSFEKDVHDFGEVRNGDVVTTTFEFTNTGNSPLEIEKVEARCGCTAPSFSDEPVAPGEKGYIEVAYDTNVRQVSTFDQMVSVMANSNPSIVHLRVKGSVN